MLRTSIPASRRSGHLRMFAFALASIASVAVIVASGFCYSNAGPNPYACTVNAPAISAPCDCIWATVTNQIVPSVTSTASGWSTFTTFGALCVKDFGVYTQNEVGTWYCQLDYECRAGVTTFGQQTPRNETTDCIDPPQG